MALRARSSTSTTGRWTQFGAARSAGRRALARPRRRHRRAGAARSCGRTTRRCMTRIGRERGWPPMTREQFEVQAGPDGALFVGSPETVAPKIADGRRRPRPVPVRPQVQRRHAAARATDELHRAVRDAGRTPGADAIGADLARAAHRRHRHDDREDDRRRRWPTIVDDREHHAEDAADVDVLLVAVAADRRPGSPSSPCCRGTRRTAPPGRRRCRRCRARGPWCPAGAPAEPSGSSARTASAGRAGSAGGEYGSVMIVPRSRGPRRNAARSSRRAYRPEVSC